MRFFIELAYDGQPFHGWQKQPNAITIQEWVETCIAKIFRKPIEVVGAGRTDAGVHARQLMAHFDLDENFDPEELVYKLNRMLPHAILVHKIYQVHPEAHARFDALKREYRYYICLGKNPFKRNFACEFYHDLNVDAMNQACKYLLEHRDFECFSKVKTDVHTFNCTIETAYWKQEEDVLVFRIVADRFLRNMVRAIVGTLMEIGEGRREVSEMASILQSKNRSEAGKSIAAKGLFLHKITYPETIKEF